MKDKKASKLEGIISIILCIICIPVIIVNVVMIVETYLNPGHLPSVGSVSPVITLSGSMEPTFGTGSLIFIKDVEIETLKKGDIICYMENGQTAVTHRIIEVVVEDGEKSFITQGDANNTTDRLPVYPNQIEGKYFAHIEGAGDVVMFMQSTTGMLVFIALPIALYLIFDFIVNRKERKKEATHTAELEAEIAALRAEKEKIEKTGEIH